MKSLRGESLIVKDVSGQSSKRRKYTPHALPVKTTAGSRRQIASLKLGGNPIDTAFGGDLAGNQSGASEKRKATSISCPTCVRSPRQFSGADSRERYRRCWRSRDPHRILTQLRRLASHLR